MKGSACQKMTRVYQSHIFGMKAARHLGPGSWHVSR